MRSLIFLSALFSFCSVRSSEQGLLVSEPNYKPNRFNYSQRDCGYLADAEQQLLPECEMDTWDN
ncbi:hypothetical protein Noda2021_04790 [Candidatus Dependentiae bacterium Noda2021]|nr:hypothetical protein Noda2021_04790 [Candidatus Dependentiae bacterium Noda2021]